MLRRWVIAKLSTLGINNLGRIKRILLRQASYRCCWDVVAFAVVTPSSTPTGTQVPQSHWLMLQRPTGDQIFDISEMVLFGLGEVF